MRMTRAGVFFSTVLAAVLPLTAAAESSVQTGTATASPGASGHVDFSVIVPKVLYLRVGSGSSYSTGTLSSVATIDLIQFAPPPASLGNGTAVAGTGGDLAGGVETAAILSNSGNVTLNATSSGALANGAGNAIAFTEIRTTAATLTSATALPAPVLVNGTSTNVVLTAPASKLISQDAKWTYSYANTATPPAGTYGGANVNNGRVVYTATMP
ncbi:MAG: hypothetical protein JSR36_15060 [Proteobacteria bacterium]|nr:hypothetical protein [Pseudomonadota bacterium]